jgi:TetR/AcrR family transcriptional regulator, tetracycline repressor protein
MDRQQIVEAALQLLDEQGLTGVTTRKIADRLGVKSASLYWHIRSREQLLDLLADRVVADARWPEPTLSWRAQVEALMGEYLRCLLAHRDAAQVAAGRPPRGAHRLRGAETTLSALLAAGLGEQEAVDATLVLTTYVVGFALERDAAAARRGGAGSETAPTASRDRYPTLERLDPLLQPPGSGSRFEAGLALILDGIEARIADRTR